MDRLSFRPTRFLRYAGFAVGVAFMVMGGPLAVSMLFPGETFVPGIFCLFVGLFLVGLAYWQYFASSCVLVEDGVLSRRMFGFTHWRIAISDASFSVGSDVGESGAYIVSVLRVNNPKTGKRLGVIPYKQFYPDDAAKLFAVLGVTETP